MTDSEDNAVLDQGPPDDSEPKAGREKRKPLMQTDVPGCPLDTALRIAKAVADNYGAKPTKPIAVAEALDLAPTSGQFKMLCGASIAYGLTEGGYNATTIALTPLGRRIVAPTAEGDEEAGRREATLRPRVIREFLGRYDGAKLPPDGIAANVLAEMEVPREACERTFALIVECAKRAGLVRTINKSAYVDLGGGKQPIDDSGEAEPMPAVEEYRRPAVTAAIPSERERRVYVDLSGTRLLWPPVRQLLEFGRFTPVVADERENVVGPVANEVLTVMRGCGAMILHVDHDAGAAVVMLAGAALALFGRRVVLVAEEDVMLPAEVRGLAEVRYNGDRLDAEATLKLLQVVNEFPPLPVAADE